MRRSPAMLGVAACLLALAAPLVAFADTASPKLTKYTKQVDESVDRALAWLAKSQTKEGGFADSYGRTNAVVALCGMAFLSKGYTPASRPYGETLNRCIDYILNHQRANGALDTGAGGGGMYSHCISTLLLSEVSGMVNPERQARIDGALAKALKLILAAQRLKKYRLHQGGWRYKPTSRDSDISVSGWALMALRSARCNGAPVPKKAIDDAVQFILNCRHKTTGGFAYTPRGGPGIARTGVALLALELTGHHGEEVTTQAGNYLLRPLKGGGFIRDRHFYYALYYCSQAMFQLGGEYWERFAEAMYKHMFKTQQKEGWWRHGSAKAYPTAMTVLALTVVYRQLPIYQR